MRAARAVGPARFTSRGTAPAAKGMAGTGFIVFTIGRMSDG